MYLLITYYKRRVRKLFISNFGEFEDKIDIDFLDGQRFSESVGPFEIT